MKVVSVGLDYVVVNSDDIQDYDFVLKLDNTVVRMTPSMVVDYLESLSNAPRKIILSSLPLSGVKYISKLEVEEAIYSDVNEKARTFATRITTRSTDYWHSLVKSYKAAHEDIVADKLFNKNDMLRAIEMARLMFDGKETFECGDISGLTETDTYGWKNRYSDEQIIQSLLPKTEWEVEFDEQGKLRLL